MSNKQKAPAAPKAVVTPPAAMPPAPAAIKNDGAKNPGDLPPPAPVTSDAQANALAAANGGAITDGERNQLLNNDGTLPKPLTEEKKGGKKAKVHATYTNPGKGLFVVGSTEFLPGVPTDVTDEMLEDEDFKTRLNYAAKIGSLTKGE